MHASPGHIWDAVDFLTWFLFVLSLETLGIHGQDGDGCGHTLLGPQSGTLASRNYPGTYPNGTRCVWKLRAPRGRTLRLAFGDFDLERSSNCDAGSLTVTLGNGATALGPLCGHLDATWRKVELNSSEATVLFVSGTHRSGRGFLLSYATDQNTDLISCMDRGSHFTAQHLRAFCPAGCRGVTGDIWGHVGQGYRDTSVLCKAAVHAGVVSDELGGPIAVSRERSITRYESTFANGLHSKTGSLSEKKLVFHRECDSQLPVLAYNASSHWEKVDSLGRRILWTPGNKDFAGQDLPWVADSDDPEPWLEIELRDRSSVTGIITKGSLSEASSFYVQSYTLLYSKDNKNWKSYKAALSKDVKVFEGNSDSSQEVLNSLIPPVVARYLLLRPKQWERKAALHVRVLGCLLLRPRAHPPQSEVPPVTAPYSPVPSLGPEVEKSPGQSSSQPVAVVVGVVLVLIVCVGVLLAGLCWKRRKKAAGMKCSLAKGSQSSLGKNLPRSESELISYPLERGACDPLPHPPLNDYAEPELMVPGQKLGSTFRPAADEGYTVPLILNHYDVPGKLPEYAEPLPPEPEYATPFTEQPPDPPAAALGAKKNNCLVRVVPPTQAMRTGPGAATLSAHYDCPGHKEAPNGYCTPAPHPNGPRQASVVYAEPQPADTLSQHTYHEPL
ncbi:discoidin, CUB and LCCL domain-containing protein 1 isoform X2 [Megalops cyprinoides]|uniref:discoidin, CUB and LCCL domain-containing protein 1 isoform X2 n=1 Tax=Megalops cyprinoides TaxID=118141 RepID=UPI001863A60D|nr:discoidin, CUB and LCCL domain-containing protein 1 isoform X2 [Megalops cyprinoides]